jgi:hypothetical protein
VLTYEATTAASAAEAWSLMAEPDRWHEWAPHLRGANGLGHPEVEPGSKGVVRLLGAIPVPARILGKTPGRQWTWQVGPATLVHRVQPRRDGALVAVDIQAPRPIEAALAVTYGPLVQLLVRNLARQAASRR